MTIVQGVDQLPLPAKSFARVPAILTFIVLEGLVIFQAVSAYQDHFATVAQMQGRGIAHGLPFVWHFAMWGDAFLISPLAAYLVGRFSAGWRLPKLAVSFAIGVIICALMSWLYMSSTIPEAHVQDHWLTTAGFGHAVYMAITLVILTQFLVFTPDVPQKLLLIVSVLLIIHVFYGTHMVLGILKAFYPLDWYPAQPLRSVVGWETILVVAFSLIWRNVGTTSMVYTYMFLTTEDPRPVEGYLKLLNRVSDVAVATNYLFKLFGPLLERSGLLPLLLLLAAGTRYFFSRTSVKQELEIGKSLFPPGRVPDDLTPKTKTEITLQVSAFLAAYYLLGWYIEVNIVASFILLLITCGDFNTRRIINNNMRRSFAEAKYAPLETEADYDKIHARRRVAEWYLFSLRHLRKEAANVAGCAIAFGLAAYGYVVGRDYSAVSYIILIVVLVLNEAVTLWWRIDRFRRLLAVDDRMKAVAAEQPAPVLSG